MRLQRDSYAPKSCAFDAANVQFLRAHLCKSHPVLQHRLTTAFGAPVADNNNLNNPRLKARSLLTQCRLSRNSQGF